MDKKETVKEQEVKNSEALNEQETKTNPESAEKNKEEDKEDKNETAENKELANLKEEVEEWKKKYLYQAAEFDNYKKRTLREKADLIKTAAERTITDILPILDDMERAMANMDKAHDLESLKKGVELVFTKLNKALEKQGLKKIETKDQDFNTDFHEAIAMIDAPTKEQKGKVVDCVQNGYTLNDKVIRPAKVAVGK